MCSKSESKLAIVGDLRSCIVGFSLFGVNEHRRGFLHISQEQTVLFFLMYPNSGALQMDLLCLFFAITLAILRRLPINVTS